MELFFILDDAQLGSNTGRIGQLFGNYIDDYLETIGSYVVRTILKKMERVSEM